MLLALLEAPPGGIDGGALQARLAEHGVRVRSDQLLTALLQLEAIDAVAVDRVAGYRFSLTGSGRDRAIQVGGGRPVHLCLLMVDLVDFTGFTATEGDAAAHDAARGLATTVRAVVTSAGGGVVKELGDGVLAHLPPAGDPLTVTRAIAGACVRPDGRPWPLRAASHVGRPIRSRDDLFGADVNLVARLCGLAAPDELVTTDVAHAHAAERVEVRGFEGPVTISRERLR